MFEGSKEDYYRNEEQYTWRNIHDATALTREWIAFLTTRKPGQNNLNRWVPAETHWGSHEQRSAKVCV